jgi:hypothetical protein
VPAFCIAFVVLFPLASAQPFRPVILDTTIRIAPDREDAEWTAIAMGRTVGLVAVGGGGHIKATRVTPDGTPLDSIPIHLSPATGVASGGIAAATCGDTFIVAWLGGGEYGETIRAALIGPDGRIIRALTLDSSSTRQHYAPSVACDGTNFLVTWTALFESSVELRAMYTMVSPEGVRLFLPRRVTPNRYGQFPPTAAWGDTAYLVVWSGDQDADTGVFCNVIRRDGSVADNEGFPVHSPCGRTSRPHAAYDGAHFVVAWEDWHEDSVGQILAARVNQVGATIDTQPRVVARRIWSHPPTVGTAGCIALVVWEHARNDTWLVRAARFDSGLVCLDSLPLELSTPHSNQWSNAPQGMAVASVDDGYWVSWAQWMDFPYSGRRSAQCRRVTAGGQLPDSAAHVVSFAASSQDQMAIASDGQNFLAVWVDWGADSAPYDRALYGARFDRQGRVLDPRPIRFEARDVRATGVAFGGGNYLVQWRREQDILGVRVDPAGRVLDTVPIMIARAGATGHTVQIGSAYGESTFVVAFSHSSVADGQLIYGARVSREGAPLDSVPRLLHRNLGDGHVHPSIASDGHTFVVAHWMVYTNSEDGVVWVTRCRDDMVLLDSQDIFVGYMQHGFTYIHPSVAYGAGMFMVAAVPGGRPGRVWPLTPEGRVVDSIPFPCDGELNPALSFGEGEFLAAHDGGGGIQGSWVLPSGEFIDSVPWLLTQFDPDSGAVSVKVVTLASATDSFGHTALVFGAYRPYPYCSSRIHAVVVPPLGLTSGAAMPPLAAPPGLASPTKGVVRARRTPHLQPGSRSRVFDMAGRLRALVTATGVAHNSGQVELDLRPLPAGVYCIQENGDANHFRSREAWKTVTLL